MSKHNWALIVLLVAAFSIAAAIGIHSLFGWVKDIHPRNITRELAQWEIDYRHIGSGDEAHYRNMPQYLEHYYRYEDMPDYRDSDVAKNLAEQRKRTIEAILAGLRDYDEQQRLRDK